MSLPRRRLVRSPEPASHAHDPRKTQRLRIRLEHEQTALRRWMARMKRAFHAVEKQEKVVSRLQRQLRLLEET